MTSMRMLNFFYFVVIWVLAEDESRTHSLICCCCRCVPTWGEILPTVSTNEPEFKSHSTGFRYRRWWLRVDAFGHSSHAAQLHRPKGWCRGASYSTNPLNCGRKGETHIHILIGFLIKFLCLHHKFSSRMRFFVLSLSLSFSIVPVCCVAINKNHFMASRSIPLPRSHSLPRAPYKK